MTLKLKLSEIITHLDHVANSAGDTLFFQDYDDERIVLEYDNGDPLNGFASDLEVEILPNGDFILDGERMTAYTSTRVDLNNPQVKITRDQFMEAFRDDDVLNSLSTDDRVEIFSHALTGSSDITADLINALISDCNVENLQVIDINLEK